MAVLIDRYQRVIDYLRLSITDHCNLHCRYCVPFSGRAKLHHEEILSYEELLKITWAAVSAGITKLRITGGEPLTRKGVLEFCRQIGRIDGLMDLSLTTNGLRLTELAADLFQAGIHRINVSLDTLKPDRYRYITGSDALEKVLNGLQAAEAAGMSPIKINTVVLRGINDDEITALARMTLTRPYHVRFIELMPTGGWDAIAHQAHFMPTEQIRQRVAQLGELSPEASAKTDGPARYFRLAGARGMIGFISPLSSHFCGTCNRLRLTADGHLRNCLFSETEMDIKSLMRRGATQDELVEIIISAARSKPMGHQCNQGRPNELSNSRMMRAIGG